MLIEDEASQAAGPEGLQLDRHVDRIVLRGLRKVRAEIVGRAADGGGHVPYQSKMQHLLRGDKIQLRGPTPNLLLLLPSHSAFIDVALERKTRVKVRTGDAMLELCGLAE